MNLPLQFAQVGFRLGDDAVVALLLAKSDQSEIVVEFACDAAEGIDRGFDLLTFAHEPLSPRRVIPEVRRLDLAVEFGEPRLCPIGVKDASGAKTGIP